MIKIPDFAGTRCVYLQACGRLLDRGAASKADMVSSRPMEKGRSYLRFLAGGPKKDHLHIDLALTEAFPSGGKPRPNAKIADILGQLDAHKGQRLKLHLLGRFIVSIEEPKLGSGLLLIGPRSIVPAPGTAAAEIVGASLAIRHDAHAHFMQWDVIGAEVLVDIFGRWETKVSDDYILDAFRIINDAFATYVLGEAIG